MRAPTNAPAPAPRDAFAAIDARAAFAVGARVRVRGTASETEGAGDREGVVAARRGDGPSAATTEVKYYVRYDEATIADEWVRVDRLTRALGESAGGSETTRAEGSRSDAATARRGEREARDDERGEEDGRGGEGGG